MSELRDYEYTKDSEMNSLKAYLVLRNRRDKLSLHIVDHIRELPPEKDEAIAEARAELADVVDKIKRMEEEALKTKEE